MKNNNVIVILGPTASGKTSLSVKLAERYNGEIISADSRQVYRDMNIGTGKDLDEYSMVSPSINYHLINIIDPTEDYSVYRFKNDFVSSYSDVVSNNKLPIVCGGTGLYLKSIINNYNMKDVESDYKLRSKLELLDIDSLKIKLINIKTPTHNSTDFDTKKRIIRAIEIASAQNKESGLLDFPNITFTIIGIRIDRAESRRLITSRLKDRFKAGMIDEVKHIMKKYNLDHSRLHYFGLEYRYISKYLQGSINYNTMFQSLNSAIHKYAKRQMTFFRYMEKNGIKINWISSDLVNSSFRIINNKNL